MSGAMTQPEAGTERVSTSVMPTAAEAAAVAAGGREASLTTEEAAQLLFELLGKLDLLDLIK